MAVGEAGCASVHGANRLGSNSLIDLVVFGRAAAIRAGEVVDRSSVPSAQRGLCREDHGSASTACVTPAAATPTAELREKMQRTMQEDAAVFRTQESLNQGCKRIWRDLEGIVRCEGHRPVDDLELGPDGNAGARQPDGQRHHHRLCGRSAQGKPRRPCPRGLFRWPMGGATTRTGASTRWPGSTRRARSSSTTVRCTPSR
jgi:hypothetical protein